MEKIKYRLKVKVLIVKVIRVKGSKIIKHVMTTMTLMMICLLTLS